MDTSTSIRFNRLLPYWAVLLTDIRQTTRSWIYRLWVIAIVVAAAGSILYKFGIHREAGIVQVASVQAGDLMKGLLGGSLGLIALRSPASAANEPLSPTRC